MPSLEHLNRNRQMTRLRAVHASVLGPVVYDPTSNATRPRIRFPNIRNIDVLQDVRLYASGGFEAIPTAIDPDAVGDRATVAFLLQVPLRLTQTGAGPTTNLAGAAPPAAGGIPTGGAISDGVAGNVTVIRGDEIPAVVGGAVAAPFNASGITIRGEAVGT